MHLTTNLLAAGNGGACLPALLVMAAVGATAAQSEIRANARGAAAAVCSVIVTGNQDRRS
ncbi:hypothetical protein V7793_08240 [Streptomyces sp. KLMMK]|uniref:hypothetical protein n=1 Tax=Streptomyces sp. KLMMK TaxID=3109353 RepID=UPI003009FE98